MQMLNSMLMYRPLDIEFEEEEEDEDKIIEQRRKQREELLKVIQVIMSISVSTDHFLFRSKTETCTFGGFEPVVEHFGHIFAVQRGFE